MTEREALLPGWPPGFHPCGLPSSLSLLLLVTSVTGDQALRGGGARGACVSSAPACRQQGKGQRSPAEKEHSCPGNARSAHSG